MAAFVAILTIAAYAELVHSILPPQCNANFRWDDCGKPPQPVIYYWRTGSRCEVGIWRGCLPNMNMFKDEYECVSTCTFTVRASDQSYHNVLNDNDDTGNSQNGEPTGETDVSDVTTPSTNVTAEKITGPNQTEPTEPNQGGPTEANPTETNPTESNQGEPTEETQSDGKEKAPDENDAENEKMITTEDSLTSKNQSGGNLSESTTDDESSPSTDAD